MFSLIHWLIKVNTRYPNQKLFEIFSHLKPILRASTLKSTCTYEHWCMDRGEKKCLWMEGFISFVRHVSLWKGCRFFFNILSLHVWPFCSTVKTKSVYITLHKQQCIFCDVNFFLKKSTENSCLCYMLRNYIHFFFLLLRESERLLHKAQWWFCCV